MPMPVLATKLYLPPLRPEMVTRTRLIARLQEGLLQNQQFSRKVSIISAPAGFGKTTLLSAWIAACRADRAAGPAKAPPAGRLDDINTPAFAWLSLDEGDSEPMRFLTYLVAALQTLVPGTGEEILGALQAPQAPHTETLLTTLLNAIAAFPIRVVLILDDYHALDSPAVDETLNFLVEHLPPTLHLVVASREDPPLPLAGLRARGQLAELRAADLRFTPAEASEFLNRVMGLNLSEADVNALEARTEGWIAGLQLAALAMQAQLSVPGQTDPASFIQSFSGSHRFVLDYLLEEVLQHQPQDIQAFLLRTSILERLCGPLCEAILDAPPGSGQERLDALDRANLFVVPLDGQRHWYRYHHLFGDLLRKWLAQSLAPDRVAALHINASKWYEKNGFTFDAFRHAAAANDVARAERLIDNRKMGLHFRSVALTILDWLASLQDEVLDARPRLWVRFATLSLLCGQTSGVEKKLQRAERGLEGAELDENTRNLIGQIACARATLALTRYDPETMLIQSRRALEYLPDSNLTFRFTANWAMGAAYLFQGQRAAATQAILDGIAISQQSGDTFSIILATSALGQAQELDNQLAQAAETYRRVLALFGDRPQPNAEEACLGLARIHYEWNDLETAETYGQRALQQARLYDRAIDRFIVSEVFLARLQLAQGDADGAALRLAQAEQSARQKNFVLRLPEIAAAQVLVLLRKGDLPAARDLAWQFEFPLHQARVLLAEGDPSGALGLIEAFRQQTQARGWVDECLRATVLQAVASRLRGETDKAQAVLAEALSLAEPAGFVRLFLDEGETMRLLIAEFRAASEKYSHKLLAYTEKLLAGFSLPAQSEVRNQKPEILTSRETEILRLIADGLTNEQIANRLYLSLYTVKAHVRNIFGKLDTATRTQAVARGREHGLL
ncbi:MAG: LuxR C-terminal-related transcriptional regulator [Chloroflexota bacterium]